MDRCDISVIISTWNNGKRLAITLGEISKCHIPDGVSWELVIINNNCTDDTDTVVKNFTEKLPIVYVKEPRQGLSRAKNKGLEIASGELIIFTDDDVKPCAEWVAAYWEAYKNHTGKFFWGGPVESEFETLDFDRGLIALAPPSVKGLYYGDKIRQLDADEFFISANWACPRKFLKASGGFDIHKGLGASSKSPCIGEEVGLMNRLKTDGLLPLYLPKAKIKHFVPREKVALKHIIKRWEAIGYNRASTEGRVSFNKPLIASAPRWMYKRIFFLWWQWLLAKVSGCDDYEKHKKLKVMIGYIRGTRALLKS